MTEKRAGGFPEYVYTFHAAMLVTLKAMSAWDGGAQSLQLGMAQPSQPTVCGAVENVLYVPGRARCASAGTSWWHTVDAAAVGRNQT